MMRVLLASALFAIAMAPAANAQAIEMREMPAVGEVHTTAVGGTVWEQSEYETVRGASGGGGVTIDAPVRANWGTVEIVDLPAGTNLKILRERTLKACQTAIEYPNLGMTLWTKCLFDLDNDGKFERVSYASNGGSKVLNPVVPYRRGSVGMEAQGTPAFRKVLLYLGVEGGSLKLTYREFASGTARPAFTEDFSIPLAPTYPQNVAVKDRVITVLGIDGMGLRYQLAK